MAAHNKPENQPLLYSRVALFQNATMPLSSSWTLSHRGMGVLPNLLGVRRQVLVAGVKVLC